MAKKRNKLEMIKDILEVLQKNRQVKITHLIYKANLSSNSIKPYIDDLMKKNLIEQTTEEDKKLYKITIKGNEFLQEYNKIKAFAESYGLQEDI